MYSRACSVHESSSSETSPSLETLANHTEESRAADEDSTNVASTSAPSATTLGEGFVEKNADEDTHDNITTMASTMASLSKFNGSYLPSLLESDDSLELEDILDDILDGGKNLLRSDSAVSKILTSAITGYVIENVVSILAQVSS